MELSTALVWTLRIVLPIILFCIYFKLQAPKDENSGPTDNVHERATLLAHRKKSHGAAPHESMKNITLKDQVEAPELFAGRGGKGGRRNKEESSRDAPGRERRGKGEKDGQKTETEQEGALVEETTTSANLENLEPNESEDRMHLESLLNYVAFTRKEQQRTFLPQPDSVPPPPPPPKKDSANGTPSSPIIGGTADKANSEAQMVLRGALGLKRSDVAKYLYEQLQEAHVETSESTFDLMINVCLTAQDLKGASDFLMKMETAGFLPHSDLLDKVMELYSVQKSAREQDKLGKVTMTQAEANARADTVSPEAIMSEADDENRTKLSVNAAVFVPSFIPPPSVQQLEPVMDLGVTNLEDYMQRSRTKLTAESKPFEPKFNVTFDPYMHTWTVDHSEEMLAQEFHKGKDFQKGGWGKEGKGWENEGKGKGWENEGKGWEHKGKGKGKGKGGKKPSHNNDKSWETNGKQWSSDESWYTDTKWSTDNTWEAAPKKMWVEKQPKETEVEQAKSDTKWGKQYVVKTWKVKTEAPDSEEVK